MPSVEALDAGLVEEVVAITIVLRISLLLPIPVRLLRLVLAVVAATYAMRPLVHLFQIVMTVTLRRDALRVVPALPLLFVEPVLPIASLPSMGLPPVLAVSLVLVRLFTSEAPMFGKVLAPPPLARLQVIRVDVSVR